MAYNFLRGDRDQPFLFPPDLRDWLPAGHLAWFVLDVTDQLDLEPFYRQHRADGHGHPAYDPKLLLGVLLYGYCLGVRSSRTIARFRVRHESALAGFLVESLKLCAAAGMVKSAWSPWTAPSWPATPPTRPTAPRRSSRPRLPRSSARPPTSTDTRTGCSARPAGMSCPRRWPARPDGWRGRGEGQAAAHPQATGAGRGAQPKATANVTDPDSRLLHTRRGRVQGYNDQAVTTCEQVIVAAELTQAANDFQQLHPMLDATAATLAAAGIQ